MLRSEFPGKKTGHWACASVYIPPLVLTRTPFYSAPICAMAKSAKTRKSVSKKFKKTGTGKLVFRSPGSRHLLTSKSRKRKRNLNSDKVMAAGDVKRYTSI